MTAGGRRRSAPFLIATVCSAQTLAQLGAFTFAALLPSFFREWGLTHSEAGWLSGVVFGAYAVAVMLILPATDRIDPKRVYLCAVAVTTLSHLGMALVAEGFWTGLLFRTMAGIGWAGKRGATLAVHAMLGYGGGFVGPLILGVLMDRLGGETVVNWGLAFGHIAAIVMVGPLALARLKPRGLRGDRDAAAD